MSDLYKIIKSLQTTQGNIAKQSILDASKDNELLREYMKAILDPAISYYITKIPAPMSLEDLVEFDIEFLEWLNTKIAGRVYTGAEAKKMLKGMVSCLNAEGKELAEYIIKRQIPGSSVGETMVLKTWPDLFFVPPYNRCAGMDEKVLTYYETLDNFYVQPKLDGSFAYIEESQEKGTRIITRQGSMYPVWFTNLFACEVPLGYVMIGEMEVYQAGNLLDRKTGNGILNSVLQGGEGSEFSNYEFSYTAWDMLTGSEFQLGKSDREYRERLDSLSTVIDTCNKIKRVETWWVFNVAEARARTNALTAAGKEGAVWKTWHGLWKNTSSGTKDAVKCKVVFEAEYKVVGYYEGEGKAKGMLGGLTVATSCGQILNSVGSGFSDAQRKSFWADKDNLIGKVVTLEANDIISSKGKTTLSLSLPIFVEFRNDKTVADDLEAVKAALETAKQGGKK